MGYQNKIYSQLFLWMRILRVHQWTKNFLLFVPLFAAHKITNFSLLFTVVLAFFSFNLCASAFYIFNDLIDIENDRFHPRKKERPFASGAVEVKKGVVAIPILLVISLFLAILSGKYFLFVLCVYIVITISYSIRLKQIVLIDCLCLALLYNIRIIAGAFAAAVPLSFWLLTFAIFLFLSLAFLKRFTELRFFGNSDAKREEKIKGRGYYLADSPLLQTMGITSGYLSVLVLSLYLNSDAVVKLYKTPILLWSTIPLMLFWVSWIWLQSYRGGMPDDPVLFAIQDKVSLVSGFLLFLFIGAATIQW